MLADAPLSTPQIRPRGHRICHRGRGSDRWSVEGALGTVGEERHHVPHGTTTSRLRCLAIALLASVGHPAPSSGNGEEEGGGRRTPGGGAARAPQSRLRERHGGTIRLKMAMIKLKPGFLAHNTLGMGKFHLTTSSPYSRSLVMAEEQHSTFRACSMPYSALCTSEVISSFLN